LFVAISCMAILEVLLEGKTDRKTPLSYPLTRCWTIEYYATAEGMSPARDFVDSLSPESKAKYIFIADLLKEVISMMTFKEHRKKLLKNKKVREEYEKLLPEYKLAKSIMERRLKMKLSQEDVARKTGMPQSTISRIEGLTHGLRKLATLYKIAAALDAQVVIRLEPKKA